MLQDIFNFARAEVHLSTNLLDEYEYDDSKGYTEGIRLPDTRYVLNVLSIPHSTTKAKYAILGD